MQHGMGTSELTSASGRSAHVRLLSLTTRTFTKVVSQNAAALWAVFIVLMAIGTADCAECELVFVLDPALLLL